MSSKTKGRKRVYLIAAFFILLLTSYLFVQVESFPFHESLRLFLLKRLTHTMELAEGAGPEEMGRPSSAIYVMGGHYSSLDYRFRTAARLYAKGLARRLIIISSPEITAYEPSFGRNLTKDEWSARTLNSLGVSGADIEILPFGEDFFGTLGESRAISALAAERGFDRLVVVSSGFHTLRVWLSFSRALEETGVELYVCGSDDPVGLKALLKEYFKVLVYRYVLL